MRPKKKTDFVSRAALKMEGALDAFNLDVAGFCCADLGASVGGFTDSLLRRGAGRVYAVDTAYGILAWSLRQDDRVVVLERTNALHLEPPETGVDLVVIDLGWTPQRYALPAALKWKPQRVLSLIKPQYERHEKPADRVVLSPEEAMAVAAEEAGRLCGGQVHLKGLELSAIRGGGGRGKQGNYEVFALFQTQSASEVE